ncbi:flagellar assembly protein FliW [Alkalicoccus daliensis]|uniref:Flagellar assembly factor FliW n=1 Tax=Alkalicoccus daliensis TaxID=745820 RepID=A0A1H0J1L6_9BACI|nr:flagellar assembly protein FliW [Alkalicoccus daliensis]SDO37329.1 flagellar assembly factor FliW [Alkalicoccus daliensis]
MNIHTKYSGELIIEESEIIKFPQGIPSFEEEKLFVLLPFSDAPGPFYILQSIETPALAFVLMNPFQFFPDYAAKLSDQTVEAMEIAEETDVSLFVILTLKDTWEESSANLRGPIVMNHVKKLGKQIILNETEYTTRHALPVLVKEGK